MKRYQATFHKYGKLYEEHVKVPVEAESRKAAREQAQRENPMLSSWKVTVDSLQEGEQAQDDRATLTLESSKLGRPVERTGDYRRITLEVRRDLLAKIDASGKSRREYIEKLLEG